MMYWRIRSFVYTFPERFWMFIAYRLLPRQLIYFAAIRLIAFATTGKHGATNPNDLNVMDALKRWERKGKDGE